jgi:purine-nucleoside phosphorylase
MDTCQHRAKEAARALPARLPGWQAPRAFVLLGAGFEPEGLYDEALGECAMSELGLASERPSAAGAPLRLLLGRIGARQVLVGHGHRYLYEGCGMPEVVLPVVAAALAGVPDLVLVGTGCALRDHFPCGSWLAATDYIDAVGLCPAEGYLELIEDPFLDMTDAFSQSLNAEILNAAARVGVVPRLGVFQATAGPQFATPAEAEVARRNGADMLGHGIVAETVVGTLLGRRVSALILAAENAPAYGGRRLRRGNVLEAARFCSTAMMRALRLALAE